MLSALSRLTQRLTASSYAAVSGNEGAATSTSVTSSTNQNPGEKKKDDDDGPSSSQAAAVTDAAVDVHPEQRDGRRKSPRLKNVETVSYSEIDDTTAADNTSNSTVKKRKADKLLDPDKNSFSSTSTSTTRNKKPAPSNYDETTMLANHWTRGEYRSRKASTWITPIRKIEFKYKKDAFLFEDLRLENGGDEVKAWIEVCFCVSVICYFIC